MSTDDSMRSRADESTRKLWMLMEADRLVLTAVLLAGIFLVLLGLVALDPSPLPAVIGRSDPVGTLFQGLLTAIVTGVTLVVTINQLVLSQELGPAGDQRDRMEGSLSFREDAAAVLDRPSSPPEPEAFLRALLDRTAALAGELRDTAQGAEDASVREAIEDFADDVDGDASDVANELDGAEFGTFAVVSAALDFEYSRKLYEGRRLAAVHGDDLDDEVAETLDDVVEALELFAPAREHVKTLYFQWELVDLSRLVLYFAVPALLVSIGAIVSLDGGGTLSGSVAGLPTLSWVVVAAATVAISPFVLLLSYILRIATVAKRTLAIGPFVLRTADGAGEGGAE